MDKLDAFIAHSYARRIQYHARKDLFNELEARQIKLPKGWLASSIDFIANLQIDSDETPHGVSTKLKAVQVLSVTLNVSQCFNCLKYIHSF